MYINSCYRLQAIVNCFQAFLNPPSQVDFPVALVISHYPESPSQVDFPVSPHDQSLS